MMMMITCVKADERSRAEAERAQVKDEVKVKDVNMQELQNVGELMQIRVENIKNNQEKGAPRFYTVKGPNIALNERTHLRATERHLSYGITQCYLPPDRGERAPP